ncbi:MAG: DUF3040 domain-containing protein [Nostocoides sp.]|uniref:DUF3040 domain-containing protein n=1 Tax=Nostocoides sp. TaxID=1917966 RepID=UPI002CB8A938|nr:DUF3040 domain-containing protein [Tetrasphaera sp.]
MGTQGPQRIVNSAAGRPGRAVLQDVEATMGLSEREQQLLDEMEQALYAEDPRFATQMQAVVRRTSHRHHLVGGVGVLAGLGLVLLGVNTSWIVGAVGFVVMVAALAYALAPPRKPPVQFGSVQTDGSVRATSSKARRARRTPRAGGQSRRGGGFMERMEERWERRRSGW